MDFDALAQSIAKQFVSVWNNPVPFLTALLLSWWVLSRWFKTSYENRLGDLNGRITLRDDQLRQMERQAERAAAIRIERTVVAEEARETRQLQQELIEPAIPQLLAEEPAYQEFVDAEVTPAFLIGLYAKNTTVQADKLASAYLGKWMLIKGTVSDVRGYKYSEDEHIGFVQLEGPPWGTPGWNFELVSLSFSELNAVEDLQAGSEIKALGQIEAIQFGSLRLENCELT